MLELERQLAAALAAEKAATEQVEREVRMLELERQLAETKAAMERLAVEREEGHKFRLWPWGA